MNNNEYDLLILEDDAQVLRLLYELFSDQGLKVHTADTIALARESLSRFLFKIVLSDHNLPDGKGVDFLAELRGANRHAVPILMTGLMDLSVAVEAINRGNVYRFVTKPLDLIGLSATIRRAADHYKAQIEQERLTREMLEHNDRLRRAAQDSERSLRLAEDRIRSEEKTVEQQKAHIETLYTELQDAYLHTVTSLTTAIEAKDRYTKGHSDRVYVFCTMMADVLGLSEIQRRNLRFASILHDLGKIGVPDQILQKPGPLTIDEHRVMATHVFLTDQILKPLPFLSDIRKIVREHHERFDGNGYPEGLKGNQISLEGRILSVADAFDAMCSHRAYRRAMSRGEAIQELRTGTGTQFCPLCAGALILGLESHHDYEFEQPADPAETMNSEDILKIHDAAQAIPVNSLFC